VALKTSEQNLFTTTWPMQAVRNVGSASRLGFRADFVDEGRFKKRASPTQLDASVYKKLAEPGPGSLPGRRRFRPAPPA
jgi:hypothetical protein